MSRGSFRAQGAVPYILDGDQYTCVQDSLIVSARWLLRYGERQVIATNVLAELKAPPNEELELGDAVVYAREKVIITPSHPLPWPNPGCVIRCRRYGWPAGVRLGG